MVTKSASAEPSQSLEIFGDGVVIPMTFTIEQLKEMPQTQNVYSAINTWPTKKWYVGKGVSLAHLFDLVEIKEDAQLIKFSSNDGYLITLTVKELLADNRYCFPHFKDNSLDNDGDGNIPGSPADKELVEPIIALESVEGSDNPKYMNDLNSLLLMLGQRAVTEQTGNLFIKYLDKIEIITSEPPKWDAPVANPDSGEVPLGTMVTLSNAHMDDDKIYYTTDSTTPTVESKIYNWISRRWWSARSNVVGIYNRPIGPIEKDTVIKAVTIGPGKLDSDVVTFTYAIPDSESETETEKPLNLKDLNNHWAQANIIKLVGSGVVSGYPDNTFKPDNTITRAEFATMLVNAFKLKNGNGKTFEDTSQHWAKDYILQATASGVVSGYDDKTFGPDNLITREQMAVMITRAANLVSSAEEVEFADSDDISSWAWDAIAAAVTNGIMKGYPDNTIHPQGSATRAEAVTIIVNALNKH
jgi:hypothetical protein